MGQLTAVSLFAGCGGFCEGIELAGFKIKCAVELDRFAAETYRHNFPKTPLFEGDVATFLNTRGADHVKQYGLANVDLVFGGPPCQGYSQIGTRDLHDPRNRLFEEFARVVATLKPKLFLMENVPNLLLLNKGHFRDLILEEFARIGYRNTTYLKVTASDFGVPQVRQRVVFVGIRDGLALDGELREFCQGLLNTRKRSEPFTVKDAISDLPSSVVPSGEVMPYPNKGRALSEFQKMMRLDTHAAPYRLAAKWRRGHGKEKPVLHNHHTKEILERRAHLISFLKPGEKADSLPKRIWNGKRPEKWRRLHPDLPSYTILAQMHRDLSEWVHPRLSRWITVREAARLQSFHDGFVFVGSEWQQLKQIGNAVPPLLAYALGLMAKGTLRKLKNATAKHKLATPTRRDLLVEYVQPAA
ncbi:MAG: DNA cytosine methyltransferase [Rhizobiales bacterium]|nr:DNA cytosine methyltransferase [Hyphomicrobiales bacterium]OJY44288.1 MAG: DNA (cytosine-5-)-methyltransferase [Rhizobiales bacterium 64-17]